MRVATSSATTELSQAITLLFYVFLLCNSIRWAYGDFTDGNALE